MPKIITTYLEEILTTYQNGSLAVVNSPLKLDKILVQKLLSSNGTITLKKAQELTNEINKTLDHKKEIEEYFVLSLLKGREKDREVIIENGTEKMSDESWIEIVRYVFEKKYKAFSIHDVLIFLFLIASLVTFCLWIWDYLSK